MTTATVTKTFKETVKAVENMTAQEAARELVDDSGEIDEDYALKVAKACKGDFHDYFEWSLPVAAYKFNLVQLRQLVASVGYYGFTKAGKSVVIPYFTHVPKTKAGYLTTKAVANDSGSSEAVLDEEKVQVTARAKRFFAYCVAFDKPYDYMVEYIDSLRALIPV